MDGTLLEKVYDRLFLEERSQSGGLALGPFENLSKLNKFATELCRDVPATRFILLSVQDYNHFLESSGSVRDLEDNILTKGTIIDKKPKRRIKKVLEGLREGFL